ncbi:MAG: hypothetical protein R3348_09010 [Xanthomonadales bacterium]|nr:hypothetical protein [Xanthomonadales bacterium]
MSPVFPLASIFRSLLFVWLTLGSWSALAQQDAPKPPKLFEAQTRLQVTLKGPWRTIERRSATERRFDGELSYVDANGVPQSFPIGITTRGLTRRDRVCVFPPLKLWFDKDTTKGTEFRGQGSLKMVTHCKKSKAYSQYYVREFLAYRIYNLITPYSFRVREMMVTYVDNERDGKPQEYFGFLIEDIDDVAERHGLEELEIPEIMPTRLDPVEISNYALFQYLISNLDWSATGGPDPVECCHNSKLIGSGPDENPVYSIPYDLDSSGLVNAHYAAPPEILKVRNIRQRLYRGFCFHNDQLPAALQRFVEQKQAIFDLFESNDLLTNKGIRDSVNFLNGFYEKLEPPGGLEEWVIDKCRG